MDDDQDRPAHLRLPETFAESGDPIQGNPYATEHPAHQVWIDATREAEMQVSRINSEAPSLHNLADDNEWMPRLVVGRFDAWARRGVQFVSTDDAVHGYDDFLVSYANNWIEAVSRLLTAHQPPFLPELALADLRRRLGARVHHWQAEARRYRAWHEEHAGAAALEVQRPPSRELIKRRRYAVQKYRDDHDLNATGFAQAAGISDSVVRAIIREDGRRFKRVSQEKLLTLIRMTREEWYRE